MSEVKVNKVSPRSGTTVTIGDSGDTINIVGTLQNNGSPLAGDISSVVAGTGLSGGATSGVATLNIEAAQPTITSLGTITGFTSTGIDDNADATAITIDSSERVGLNTTTPGAKLEINSTGSYYNTANQHQQWSYNGTPFLSLYMDAYASPYFDTDSASSWNPGATMVFKRQGTEKMRIDSSGNVGIKNTVMSSFSNLPATDLVVGAGTTNSGITIYSSDSTASSIGFADGASGDARNQGIIQYHHNGDYMRFFTNAAERMRINSSGFVGIGTSSPGTVPLNVVSTDDGNVDDILEIRNNSTTSGTGARLRFVSSTDPSSVPNSVSISSYRNAGSDHDILFESSGSEKMRIRSTGLVGIGTSSPSEQLDISSTGPRIRFSDTSVTNLRHVIGSEANDLEIRCDDGNVQADSHIGFKIDGSEHMRIKSTGQVGIGNSGPGYTLEIGNAYSGVGLGFNLNNNVGHIRTRTDLTDTQTHHAFVNPNGTVGTIKTNASATSFNTSSDYRLKENVDYNFDATTRLKQLKPARFNFIANANTTVDGFLAHEVQSIVPEAITGTKDATETKEKVVVNSNGQVIAENIEQADWETGKIADEDGNTQYPTDSTWEATKIVPDYQGIDQSKLVPLLVKTIQELEARITTLENA